MKNALAILLTFACAGLAGAADGAANEAAEKTKAATTTPEGTPAPTIKYKDGALSLEFERGGLSFTNRLQFRATGQFPDAETQLPGTVSRGDQKTSFRIRRFEPQIQGWVYTKALTFKVELALQDLQNNAVSGGLVNDAFFAYDFTKGRSGFRVQAGQFKAPFGRQELTSSFSLQFVDRSIVAGEFERGRDLGVQVDGLAFGKKLDWRAGAFNGNGRGVSANDNARVQLDARVTFQPFGDVKYSDGDFESTEKPLFAIAFQTERNDNSGASSSSSSAARVSACPCGASGAFRSDVYGVDAVFKYRGFAASGAYYARRVEPLASGSSSFDSNGFHAEAGYLFGSRRFQIAARFASWDPTNAVADNAREERGVVLNWFYNRHFAKVQADVREILDRAKGTKDRELRIQTQLAF